MTVIELRPAAAVTSAGTTAVPTVKPQGRPAVLRPPGRPPSATVRELGPGETDVLDAVFAGLSDRSRYLRFHGATPRLTAGVRRHLAAVDGQSHLAVAAYGPDGEPVGIARLVGLDHRRAELAIEVVDAWQGRGIGRRLLSAVAARGREEGYTRLVADVLTENVGMRALLASLLPILSVETEGYETTLTADLSAAAPIRIPAPLHTTDLVTQAA